jgi:O-antigen/teichoic acid export membrane protein
MEGRRTVPDRRQGPLTMSGIGNRTAILTISRLANYGLMLISPIFLVRLLSVADFGRYREFLLYGALLQAFAQFSINDSLLYCVPANPGSPWRVARQTAVLTFCSSSLVALALIVLDTASGGALVQGFLVPLVAYTLVSVNLDFWEHFWLARGHAQPVFIYTAVRLATRVVVVVVTATLTHDFHAVIWSLVALEGARFAVAAVAMLIYDRSRSEPPLREPWRDQLRFCLPSGTASLLATLNRNVSSVIVARLLGAAALAQYAIGRFGEPVVTTLRSSISTVILPEMVRKDRGSSSGETALELWQKATVINAIMLFPVVVLVARYAEPLVTMVFGASYATAGVVMQVYMLVVVRECFDFAPALRAVNRTRGLVESNVAGLITCAVAMFLLIPIGGLVGAMFAFVIASYVDASWLAWRTCSVYQVGVRQLIPWNSIGKTALAAAMASVLIVSSVWTEVFGRAGMAIAGVVYLAAFALLLQLMRIPEARVLQAWGKRLVLRHSSEMRQ